MQIEPPDDLDLELIESTDGGDPRPVQGSVDGDTLELAFSDALWYWRGPSPFHFLTVPPDAAGAIRAVAAEITYGWGMIPAMVRIGGSAWSTALWPKDGGYVVPIKDAVRKAEGLELGDSVTIQVVVRH